MADDAVPDGGDGADGLSASMMEFDGPPPLTAHTSSPPPLTTEPASTPPPLEAMVDDEHLQQQQHADHDGGGGSDDGMYDGEPPMGSGFENDIDMEEEFRGRGRGFRNWTGGADAGPRFRGRGYGPGGPPGFRGRGGPPPPMFGRGGGGATGPRNGTAFPGGGPPPGFTGSNWGPPGQMGAPPNMMAGNFGPPGLLGGPPTGPPPLMGSNGQFAAATTQPPPLDINAEIWVETKSPDGKPYYYNARTRETTWTKPDGPNIKVILQDQVEAMAQAATVGQMAPGTTTAAQAALAQANITNKPEEDDLEKQANGMPPMMMQPPPGMARFPAPIAGQFGGPPFGMPPPGFQAGWGAPGGAPAPWSTALPPGAAAPWGIMPTMSALPAIDEAAIMSKIDPDLIARATEWTEHKAPDGRFYYYHAKKGESVWEKPQEMKDLETAKLAAAQGISTRPMDGGGMLVDDGPGKQEQVNGELLAADGGQSKDDDTKAMQQQQTEEEEERAKKLEEEKAKEAKAQDKSRPVSSTPVPGTPWCVVWTGDGRVFFYNPSSRTSVWERPDDLLSRSDVDKMVANAPEAISGAPTKDAPVKQPAAKRASDDSDSDDEVPTKKAKTDEISTNGTNAQQPPQPPHANNSNNANNAGAAKKIDIGKEAAMEAEVRAAKERAVIPLDTRIKSFKEMLAEKEVSAFSTWEKELHKIVFDHRYLLLTSKERKQVFEKYVKERAEDERREKRNKLRERKDAFKKLLSESHLHGKSSFSDFAQKFAKDERFKGVEKMRERESLFNEHLIDVRRREKEEKSQRREMVKKDFFAMLREHADLDRHARWSDVKKKFDGEARYKAVDSSGQREDWWREYCKLLKEEKKRAKEKEREHKKDKEKHKKRGDKEQRSDEKRERRKSDRDDSQKTEDNSESAGAGSQDDVKKDEDDTKAEDGSADKPEHDNDKKKNDADNEECPEGGEDDKEADKEAENEREREKEKEREREKEKDRQARAEVSLREREKEVQRTLATHMRDRDKEREQHKRDEAIQHFIALLSDLVRSAELGWREVKRILRKDQRWDLADTLSRDEKEKLFNEHIETIVRKKREKFRELLDETAEVTLTSTWKEIKRIIKEDPRYTKFASSERCEREFKDYLKDKLITAKGQFKELLQETKLITHKSLSTLRENQSHMMEIEEILKNDKRYLVLDFIPQERTQLILNYLEELDRRGPPPPPTASEPSRRTMK